MALKGFLALNDKTLAEQYAYVAPDKTRHRKPFLAGLAKAETAFGEGKQPRGGTAMWSAANNIVRFTPKLAGTPIAIEGETVFHIPAERFPNAIAELRKSVEAGELDDTLHAAVEGASKGGTKVARDPNAGSVRAGWSEERRQRFAASIAAKKAAKEGGADKGTAKAK